MLAGTVADTANLGLFLAMQAELGYASLKVKENELALVTPTFFLSKNDIETFSGL